MRKTFIALALTLVLAWGQAMVAQRSAKVSVAFYNLENLFDTVDNENDDADFLPGGSYGWTEERYLMKLDNMASAIAQIADGKAPDILGVCELENRNVLEDLVAHPKIAAMGYAIAHFDSPDRRGIDVALLYRPKVLRFTGAMSHRVKIPGEPHIKTRDVLEVSGNILGEEVTILVGHWPSRAGGEQISLNRRMAAAKLMRSITDSVMTATNNEAKVILMGDFNDDPTSPSLTEGLKAHNREETLSEPTDLFNIMAKLHRSGMGTLGYQNTWNLFDNIIVTANMIMPGSKGLQVQYSKSLKSYGAINNAEMLTQQTGFYKGYPLRTTSGGVFQNGYSDHYPVYMYLIKAL